MQIGKWRLWRKWEVVHIPDDENFHVYRFGYTKWLHARTHVDRLIHDGRWNAASHVTWQWRLEDSEGLRWKGHPYIRTMHNRE